MITVFNAQNYAQQWFFEKAFATLKANGKLNEDELRVNRFLSLDGYFAHMRDLVTTDPSFILLPSDEKPFEIDANARTISIPANFNKCAGVSGDDMCEIITFTVDRFFDYVDLATTSICIQWINSQGEGVSHIKLIDYETVPGKIRFGWPLTKELTEKPGPITFSVRFFMKDNEDNFVYLLNTLSSTITIREGLNIVKPAIVEDDIDSLFGQFVQNSENPSYPIPAPVYFNNTPGLNLPSQEKLVRDTLTMKAQAVVSDNGHIVYNWYFKERATPADRNNTYVKAEEYIEGTVYYTYDNSTKTYVEVKFENGEELEFNKGTYYIKEQLVAEKISNSDERFEIKEVYEKIANPTKRDGSEQYFKKVVDAESGIEGYQLVTSSTLPTEEDLYERFTTLQIVPETGATDITGLYWVGASNYVGEDKYRVGEEEYDPDNEIYAINHTPETNSSCCYVPTPDQVNITTDLTTDKFLNRDADGNLTTTLSIVTEIDGGDPARTYTWYYKGTNEADYTAFDPVTTNTAAGNSYKIVQAEAIYDEDNQIVQEKENKCGWYYADIKSELNRATTNGTSAVCRVLEPIRTPILQKLEYAHWTTERVEIDFNNPDHWSPVYDITDETKPNGTEMTDEVAGHGSILRLRIKTDLDNEIFNKEGLVSDKLIYKWYIIEPDKEAQLLDQSFLGISNYLPVESKYETSGTKNYIDVRCITNREYPVKIYCEVTNTLAEAEATLGVNAYSNIEMFQLW